MPSARLRRAFKYPDDKGSSDEDLILDEQQQDEVISQLVRDDASSIAFFRKLFMLLPGIGVLYYIRIFAFSSAFSSHPLLHFAGLISLGLSFVMASKTGIREPTAVLPALTSSNLTARSLIPLLMNYATSLNASLCLLLLLRACLEGAFEAQPTQGLLISVIPPTLTFSIIVLATRNLQPVDIEPLGHLRYVHKGV